MITDCFDGCLDDLNRGLFLKRVGLQIFIKIFIKDSKTFSKPKGLENREE